MTKVFICAAKRTPIGSMLGTLKGVHPADLGAVVVKNILEEKNIPYIERNDIESAITAGFGSADKAVHLFVLQEDEEKAQYALVENNFDDIDEVGDLIEDEKE